MIILNQFTAKKTSFLVLMLIKLFLCGNNYAQTTYYVGPWDPILYPPIVGSPGWEIQDDNVTGLSTDDPFASWSQAVNVINDTPMPNTTVNLFSDAYIEAYDYDNDMTDENGILGHNLGVQLVVESTSNGLSVLGSTDGCYSLLDNTANGNGNLFASIEGASDITFKGLYLLNGFAGAFDIINSTNVVFEDCIFDNNDLGAVPVFRISSSNGTPMNLSFKNCSFINHNNNTAKFDITRSALGSLITIDFQDCVWSCNSATSTAGTAIRVRNGSSSQATALTFTGCTFANNASGGSQGGAVYFENTMSVSTFTNCNFINNSVAGGNGGGAIFIGANEDVTIDGCTFYGNVSMNLSADGGAIAAVATSTSGTITLDIMNSTFDNNTSADDGGAVQLRYVNATMTNLHILNNNAGDGVITLANTSTNLTISNYTCGTNSAPDGCIYNRGPGTLTDNGGSATGTPVDLSSVAPDYACGAYCAAIIPGLCLAIDQGAALCGDPAGMGSICGSVFQDDLDGEKEIGTDDAPLVNAYIILYDFEGNLIGRTNSDSNGDYCFNDIPDGSYYVSFAPPDSDPGPGITYYNATLQDHTGNGMTDSDIDQFSLTSHLIIVDNASGTTGDDDSPVGNLNTINVDAGFTQVVTISGTLYLDDNLNDTFNLAETNIVSGPITVSLYDQNTMMVIDVVTTTAGMINTGASYTFLNVPPGNYTVILDTNDGDIPSNINLGTPDNVADIVVSLTESVGGIDFGFDPRLDIDQDDDGIPDVTELFYNDEDNDGTPDYADPDFCTDNFSGVDGWDCANGLPDPDQDLDGDNTPNWMDPDFPTCGGVVNGVCSNFDQDGDGIPNHLDLDSDNDGITDVVEAGGSDPDNDGIVGTGTPTDSDGDGLSDDVDPDGTGTTNTSGQSDTNLPVNDQDGDGIPNQLDLDADNDGIVDIIEAGGNDTNGDGMVDGPNCFLPINCQTDLNMNGWADGLEGMGNGHPLPNTDGFGMPNWLDIDADDDGITDNVEGQSTSGFDMDDVNNDNTGGFVAPTGDDDDGDGIDNAYDNDPGNFGGSGIDADVVLGNPIPPHDFDRDGTPDYLDTDSDNDNVSDHVEGHDFNHNADPEDDLPCILMANNTVPRMDADNDGLLDCYDNPSPSPDPTMVGTGTGNCPLTGLSCVPEDTDPTAGDNDDQPDFRDIVTALPLELIAFTGTLEDCAGLLFWITAYEQDVKHISIQKSQNGIEFYTIADIEAQGNATGQNTKYEYLDKGLRSLVYYRLKIVNTDGTFAFSELITIKSDCVKGISIDNLYPNPTTQLVNYELFSEFKGDGIVNITDVLGRKLFQFKISIEKGVSNQRLNLTNLSTGVYYLQAEINGVKSIARKIVKLDK